MKTPGSPTMRRLSSWKEIAAHLGVSVRTAQNWERRFGLPVHRLGEGPRAHVFADLAELDAWFARVAPSAPPGDEQPRARRVARPVRRLAALLALAFAALALGMVLRDIAGSLRTSEPARVEPAGVEQVDGRLFVVSRDGAQAWSIPLAGLALEHYRDALSGASGPFHRLFDIDGDGRRELLFVETPADRRVRSSALACYDDTGRRLWRTDLAEPLSWNGETFHGFSGRILGIVQAPERTYVVTAASNTRFPAQVALIDLHTGSRVGIFRHPGTRLRARTGRHHRRRPSGTSAGPGEQPGSRARTRGSRGARDPVPAALRDRTRSLRPPGRAPSALLHVCPT